MSDMYMWIDVAAVLLLSVVCAGVLIPRILLISFRKRLFDRPDERKIHQCIVPRLGGIAFVPVIMISVMLVTGVSLLLGDDRLARQMGTEATELSFACCSLIVLYLVGIADDLIGVRYRAKFVMQILCGLFTVVSGLWVCSLYGVFGLEGLPAWAGWPLTVFLVVFVINAINLIDGIDGLASGLSAVALMFYGVVLFSQGEYVYALLSFATLGTIVPFFYYNVFGNPQRGRKIFMGDTGSLTIGFILCFLSVQIVRTVAGGDAGAGCNRLIVAFAPLFIPCFDVVRVVIHRLRAGRNPFTPDKSHIHHKLLAAGMTQRQAMVTIIASATAFTACNMWLSCHTDVNILLAADIALYTFVNIWLTRRIKARVSLSTEV